MRPAKDGSHWVRFHHPVRFGMGLEEMARIAGWRIRREGSSVLVCSQERYLGTRPRMITAHRLADRASASDALAYAALRAWPSQGQLLHADDIRDLRHRIAEAGDPKSEAEAWAHARVDSLMATDGAWPDHVALVYQSVVAARPDATVWGVRVDPQVTWRMAAARSIFAVMLTPEVLEVGTDEAPNFFPASLRLLEGWSIGMFPYVEIATLATSPWPVGMVLPRVGGPAVILFGKPVTGFTGREADDILSVFRATTIARSDAMANRPSVTPEGIAQALRWWVARLDDLVAVALDVGRFRAPIGDYDPIAHEAVLLSLERLFVAVHTILAQCRRQEFVRAVLMFDVMDMLEGLGYSGWDALLSPRRCRRLLTELEAAMPPGVADVLLYRVRPAVDALEKLQAGFPDPGPDGSPRRDTDAGSLLRALRNATHSYRSTVGDPRHVLLLARHSGEIPDALADLALLQLLAFLRDPFLPTTSVKGARSASRKR